MKSSTNKNSVKKRLPVLLVLLIGITAAVLYWQLKTPALPNVQISNDNGWRLLVNGKPFLIKGVCYQPIPVGRDHEFNFWGDPKKPWIQDGKLMKSMGVNTVRFYRLGKNPQQVRRVLTDLNKQFGIYVLAGHYLGFGDWPPADYSDPNFRAKITEEVLEMVRVHKDTPGILMWVLGNENNYTFDRNVQPWSNDEIDSLPDDNARRRAKARIYYSFVNDLALAVKKIDNRHPVVMAVGEVISLDVASEVAPDIDIIGMISYRGPGFGNLFRQVQQRFDKPVVMIEWGADSYNAATKEPDEENQAQFIKLQWLDIERNADPKKGVGNSLGGTLFEWQDEWWKSNEGLPHTWSVQDTTANWSNPSYHFDAQVPEHMNMNEEWFGAVRQTKKKLKEGYPREPKEIYYILKELWTKPKK